MGDRSNIFIQTRKVEDKWEGVGVYGHRAGQRLHNAAIAALPKAQGRIGDEAYFTRIIIHNVLNAVADANEETGCGIWIDGPCDNDGYPILVINALTGHRWFTPIGNERLDESQVKALA